MWWIKISQNAFLFFAFFKFSAELGLLTVAAVFFFICGLTYGTRFLTPGSDDPPERNWASFGCDWAGYFFLITIGLVLLRKPGNPALLY